MLQTMMLKQNETLRDEQQQFTNMIIDLNVCAVIDFINCLIEIDFNCCADFIKIASKV